MLLVIVLLHQSLAVKEGMFGNPSASPARITTDLSPDFSKPIDNVTAPVGREAVLTCSVTNLGQYKVGWMKADDQTILSLHTRVITHNPRISVTHDDVLRTWQLRIRQLKESDRGCYMCQINTSEMKKQLGCVDVQVPPDIDDEKTSGDTTVTEGDNATLTCEATGHPDPRIMWRREDGKHILLQTGADEKQRVDTYTGTSLNFVRLQRQQMGAYLCIASNDVPPAVSKRIVLSINFHPSVQVQTPLVGALVGCIAKLRCDIEAFPNADNYWIKDLDGVLLNGTKHRIHQLIVDYRVVMTLTVVNVTANDYGSYSCISSNAMGKDSGPIKVYEIKRPTTTTTTTTQATTTTTELITTTKITHVTLSTSAASEGERTLEEDSSENLLYPSLAPRQLELETHSRTVAVVYCPRSVLVLVALGCTLLR